VYFSGWLHYFNALIQTVQKVSDAIGIFFFRSELKPFLKRLFLELILISEKNFINAYTSVVPDTLLDMILNLNLKLQSMTAQNAHHQHLSALLWIFHLSVNFPLVHTVITVLNRHYSTFHTLWPYKNRTTDRCCSLVHSVNGAAMFWTRHKDNENRLVQMRTDL
jgi:hypothetical protein